VGIVAALNEEDANRSIQHTRGVRARIATDVVERQRGIPSHHVRLFAVEHGVDTGFLDEGAAGWR